MIGPGPGDSGIACLSTTEGSVVSRKPATASHSPETEIHRSTVTDSRFMKGQNAITRSVATVVAVGMAGVDTEYRN